MNSQVEVARRCKRVVQWLISQGYGETDSDIYVLMGYERSFAASVLSGKDKMSARFLNAICRISPRINRDWIETGNGNMLLDNIKYDEYMVGKTLFKIQEDIKLIYERLRFLSIQLNAIMEKLD